MDRINREAYLAYSYALKPEELRIMDELLSWLPDEIVDAHAHCNRAEHVLEIDDKTYHRIGSTFPYFDLEESEYLHQAIFLGKQVRTLRFAMPYKRTIADYNPLKHLLSCAICGNFFVWLLSGSEFDN